MRLMSNDSNQTTASMSQKIPLQTDGLLVLPVGTKPQLYCKAKRSDPVDLIAPHGLHRKTPGRNKC